MTNEQFEKLESLARAATPGPWEAEYDGRVLEYEVRDGNYNLCAKIDFDNAAANAAYIAAANPAAVLALIAELRQARADACHWIDMARCLARELGGGVVPEEEWLNIAREAVAAQAVMDDPEEVAAEIERRDK